MGTVGDAYDNAMAESVFASLECELFERRSFKTKTEARLAVFTWIEAWYNPRRRHSAHGRISPLNFEKMHADRTYQAPSSRHGLPTAGLCVADATPAVDNPAPMLAITSESRPQPSAGTGRLHFLEDVQHEGVDPGRGFINVHHRDSITERRACRCGCAH